MIQLFEYYHQESQDLHATLNKIDSTSIAIVIDPDGFLPDGVISPFTYFLGDSEGKPLYFNQVSKPKFWLIDGNNSSARIMDHTSERAKIHYYQPNQNRFVKEVEWLNELGQVRKIDSYNRFGRRFAQKSFTNDNKALFTSYYSVENKEIILENHVTGDIILTLESEPLRIFKNRTEFLIFFLRRLKVSLDQIIINTLSFPFFVSYNLPEKGEDILFWQEPIYNEIPGNMRLIFEQNIRVKKVMVPDKATYHKLWNLLPEEHRSKLSEAGYLYDFKKVNGYTREALILTNSDQIEQLDTIVSSLPNVHFRIAALTEMSAKLREILRYENVTLYPNVSYSKVEELYRLTDIYLDINYGDEILQAVRNAFINDLLIFSLEETVHNTRYIARENIFSKAQVEEMILEIKSVLDSKELVDGKLARQKEVANSISKEELLNKLTIS